MKLAITEIKPNPINDEIYSTTDLSDLVSSIKTHGQLEPIVINKDNTIISGHRRYFAMNQLGWKKVDVRVSQVENEVVALIEHNRARVKSVSDILNESRYLEKELKKVIGRGRYAVAQRNGKRMETIIEVSKKLGLSTTQLKKIKSISNYEPELISQVDMGEMSVNHAYELVREKYIKRGSKGPSSKVEFQKRFSKLIDEYQPSQDDINQILSKTYPYSVASIKNGEVLRDELVEHLDTLKKMDAKELAMFRKYKEVKRLKPKPSLVEKVERELWQPNDIRNKEQTIREIEKLEPVIQFIENGTMEHFNILRVKTSSMDWNMGPGRSIKCVVRNKPDGRTLGVITLASDMIAIEGRDNYIGWSSTQKHKRLTNLAVLSTCVATQPLGFNFLGGKLIASLATTEVMRDKWVERYGNRLIGLTTTSLYGQFSMYNAIPLWKSLGETKGSVFIRPDDEYYSFWFKWIKEHFPAEYEEETKRSSPKENIVRLIFKYLNIPLKEYETHHRRGIYFANIYQNGREFLCDEIGEDELVVGNKFQGDTEGIMEWWVPKAVKRYTKLFDGDKVEEDTLFYDDISPDAMRNWFASRGLAGVDLR